MDKIELNISDEHCPLRKSLEIIGGKWTMLIIYQINKRTIRYGDLKRSVVGISEKMLISQLKFLTEKGLVHKKAYAEIPPRVEYSLTDSGKELLPVINNIIDYSIKHNL